MMDIFTTDEIKKLKSDILCLGCSVTADAAASLLKEMPWFYEKKFSYSIHGQILGFNIAITATEKFNENSPCRIMHENGTFKVLWHGKKTDITFFDWLPQTGTILDRVCRFHSPDCLTIWPSTNCCYDAEGVKCKFCSIEKEAEEPMSIDEIVEGFRILLPKMNFVPSLNLSGGTYKGPNHMIGYWQELITKLREFYTGGISIELTPPYDLSLISDLKKAGVNNLVINLEVADEKLRNEICPGKSMISKEHYYAAFKEGVKNFGWGQISSVLIAGIQPDEDIMKECCSMAQIGVIPSIMPFRPFDGVQLKNEPVSSERYLMLEEHAVNLMKKYRLNPDEMVGCTKCGGCCLENDCYKWNK